MVTDGESRQFLQLSGAALSKSCRKEKCLVQNALFVQWLTVLYDTAICGKCKRNFLKFSEISKENFC